MVMKFNKSFLYEFLVSLYVLFAVLCINVPKKIIFLAIIACSIAYILKYMLKLKMIFLYGAVYPVLLIVLSTIMNVDLEIAFKKTFCMFTLLLIIPIIHFKIDYETKFYRGIILVVILTLIILVLDILGIADINEMNPIKTLVYKYDLALMGKSSDYYFYRSIFFYASGLFPMLFLKKLSEKKWFITILVYIAIIATGERTPVFLGIMGALSYWLFFSKDKYNINGMIKRILMIAMICIGVIIFADRIYDGLNQILFTKGADSNNVRILDFQAIVKILKQNPIYLITGQGMGSMFYSPGHMRMLSDTEISYVNLFRMMGIPNFCLFMMFLLYPFKYIPKSDPEYLGYILYLIQAGLNPYLLDSTAFLVYIFVYSKYVYKNSLNKEVHNDLCYYT